MTSNPMRRAREALAATLADHGLPVVSTMPDRPAAPQVIITPGTPWISAGSTYGTADLQLKIIAIVRPSSQAGQIEALENMITAIAGALNEIDGLTSWDVGAPITLASGSDALPAVEIPLQIVISK